MNRRKYLKGPSRGRFSVLAQWWRRRKGVVLVTSYINANQTYNPAAICPHTHTLAHSLSLCEFTHSYIIIYMPRGSVPLRIVEVVSEHVSKGLFGRSLHGRTHTHTHTPKFILHFPCYCFLGGATTFKRSPSPLYSHGAAHIYTPRTPYYSVIEYTSCLLFRRDVYNVPSAPATVPLQHLSTFTYSCCFSKIFYFYFLSLRRWALVSCL